MKGFTHANDGDDGREEGMMRAANDGLSHYSVIGCGGIIVAALHHASHSINLDLMMILPVEPIPLEFFLYPILHLPSSSSSSSNSTSTRVVPPPPLN